MVRSEESEVDQDERNIHPWTRARPSQVSAQQVPIEPQASTWNSVSVTNDQ